MVIMKILILKRLLHEQFAVNNKGNFAAKQPAFGVNCHRSMTDCPYKPIKFICATASEGNNTCEIQLTMVIITGMILTTSLKNIVPNVFLKSNQCKIAFRDSHRPSVEGRCFGKFL